LGVLLAMSAVWLGGSAWVLVWPAIAVTTVGLGYLGLGPAVFGKRHDGTLKAPHFVLLLPYHVVAWLRVQWDAYRHAEDPWHEVAPGLFLGRIVQAHALPKNTRVVVDLTSEFPASAALREGRVYHCLPTLDTSVPDYDEFAKLARLVATHEGAIYVHCAAGHGRSATFAAAVLIARGQAHDVSAAEAKMRAVRPTVHLHRGQRALVERFTRELREDPVAQTSSMRA
jgi:protein-tyrosine phosphatase